MAGATPGDQIDEVIRTPLARNPKRHRTRQRPFANQNSRSTTLRDDGDRYTILRRRVVVAGRDCIPMIEGRASRHLLQAIAMSNDVFGVDISPVGVENARQWLARRGLSARLAVQDLAALDLPDERFRLVVCAGSSTARAMRPPARPFPGYDAQWPVSGAESSCSRAIATLELRMTRSTSFMASAARKWKTRSKTRQAKLFIDRYITTYRGRTV
jgi:Methyltransferase domain